MAEWSSWLPDVRRLLPQCPDPLILHAVKRAAQAFCMDTGAWRALLDPVAVASGASSVVLVPAAGTEIVKTLNLWFDGQDLSKTTADDLFKDDPKWIAAIGSPAAWFEEDPGTVRLYPLPESAATSGLAARVSLKPSESATGIGDVIASRYRNHVADKALSILMMDPGKSWTNLEQAAFRKSEFDSATAEIRTRLALDSVRVRSRPAWC